MTDNSHITVEKTDLATHIYINSCFSADSSAEMIEVKCTVEDQSTCTIVVRDNCFVFRMGPLMIGWSEVKSLTCLPSETTLNLSTGITVEDGSLKTTIVRS